MGNKFGLLLLWLMYLTFEILTMIAMATLLSKGQKIFAIITMFGVCYYGTKTLKLFKMLIDSFKQKGE